MAPFLCDSPCTNKKKGNRRWWSHYGHPRSLYQPANLPSSLLGSSFPMPTGGPPLKSRFSVRGFNAAVTAHVAPLVDLGWFCTREVEKTLHELIKVHTQFKHLTEEKVFQEIAIITIMFGNLSGGLRQRCVREALNASLFSHDRGNFTNSIYRFMAIYRRG